MPGEEICICYYAALFLLSPQHIIGMSAEEEFHHCKNQLASDYGMITCLPNCSCHDPTIRAAVKDAKQLVAFYILCLTFVPNTFRKLRIRTIF